MKWQENPIATSITTHPIDDLDFPNVTICPPKNSNTALYHDLVKVGNRSLSNENREILTRAAFKIFIENSHKEHVKNMLATLHMENLDQVLQGFHSVPTRYNDANGLKTEMWNLNGTITTPWFRGNFVEEYYREDKDFLVVLRLPGDIRDQVGTGSLVIKLEVDTREEPGWVEDVTSYILHTTEKTWFEAETYCQKEGGHLASVATEEVHRVVENMDGDVYAWLGGRKELGKWTWSDNSTWGFTNWRQGEGNDANCVSMNFIKGGWDDDPCTNNYKFICQKKDASNGENVFTKDQLSFASFVVWYKRQAATPQMLDSWKDKRMTGFRLSWRVINENPPLMARISELGRSIRTPLLGDSFNEDSDVSSGRLYKAMLSPSKDLREEVENGSLVIELNIDMKPPDELNAFTRFKLHKEKKSWNFAKVHCESEGGEIASIHSQWEQTLAK